jgi:transcriptional regulator with PAS, ATPase and Fis domain
MASAKSVETLDESAHSPRAAREAVPGLLVVWSGRAVLMACPIPKGGVVLGRNWLAEAGLEDERASREHLRATWAAGRVSIEDLSSRNGTFVDGLKIEGKVVLEAASVVRMGQTIALLCDDLTRFTEAVLTHEDVVRGPASRAVLKQVTAAAASSSLLLLGESGVGKEIYARAFHANGKRAKGNFVAVNCAAIPVSLAERLFFGAKEGAYSGAKDAEGYAQAAHRGTLFLDEIGELEPSLQPKLLRLLESREVMAVGGSRADTVDVAICAATNRDLRQAVSEGKFRSDLYYRLSEPVVTVPPLASRREELSYLIAIAVRKVAPELRISAKFVEACLLRRWPGNVRELLSETAHAARQALMANEETVGPEHLSKTAGLELGPSEDEREASIRAGSSEFPADEAIERALTENGGNISAAARALGLQRGQLRRWLARPR